MDTNAFVLSQLPPPPARVLEIGCGGGELAQELDGAGYRVLAIDPEAPEGPIFRRVRLEELDDRGPFDAAVAVRSLHHVEELATALDRVVSVLEPGGLLVLEEFGWDLFDRRTAAWYAEQKRAPVEKVLADWEVEHRDLHGYGAMRRELDRRFDERFFAWRPYLYLDFGPETKELECELIARGAIEATAFRYVGVRR